MASNFTNAVSQAKPAFDFVAAHFQCETNRYSPSNPEGFVNFGSAQNHLHSELMSQKLASLDSNEIDMHYQSFYGTEETRMAIANYLSDESGVRVLQENIVVGNGLISLLEALTICLLNKDETVLIPTPVFPGLVAATSLRVESKIEFMDTDPANDFRVLPSELAQTMERLAASDKKIRAILLCSPGNPVGQIFSESELRSFLEIAERFNCYLIVDEIYMSSVFEGQQFTSAAVLDTDRVFILGGLSKDFGVAGHATGWLQSRNKEVIAAVAKQSHFFRLPAPTQRTLTALLQPEWRTEYLPHHQKQLTEIATIARDKLNQIGATVTPSDSGLCHWLDLRPFVSTLDVDGEMELYQQLLNEHRVHISPGCGFKTNHFGFFRMCFSQSLETLNEGINRLARGLVKTPIASDLVIPANQP